jgi:catechol 2,3-dioxygenase-like lactoylglutathione lyase family enzyme
MATLSQVYLLTPALERSRAFFEDALGLTPDRVGDSSVSYGTGGCELKIQADHDPETLASFGLERPPDSGRGAGAVYVLTVDEPVAAVHDRVAAALEDGAGTVLTEPRTVPWGGTMFLVRSPSGYVFEVRERESGE